MKITLTEIYSAYMLLDESRLFCCICVKKLEAAVCLDLGMAWARRGRRVRAKRGGDQLAATMGLF